MNAIVMNTLNGAVSEYSGFDFQAITPTHAGSATALSALGGDLDVAAKIVGSFVTGKALLAENRRTHVEMVFMSMKGSGSSTFTLTGELGSYDYLFDVLSGGVSRIRPGRGFRENYASFGYSNTDGASFQIDSLEVITPASRNRRTE